MGGSSSSELNVDDHFITFEHAATFPVGKLCSLAAETGLEGSSPFEMNHNKVIQKLSPWMLRKTFPVKDKKKRTQLWPSLRLCSSSPHKSIKANYKVWALLANDKLISEGEKEFIKSEQTLLTSVDNSLPITPEELTQMGYLSDGGINLKLKYELKIHRSYFVDKYGNYDVPISAIVAPVHRPATDFDQVEFEELMVEVKDNSRIVLEADDGTRFCAHRNRLLNASDFFLGAFDFCEKQDQHSVNPHAQKKHCDVLQMPCMSGKTLKQMLSFIYMGNVSDGFEDVIVELSYVAETYLLNDLKTHCHARLLELAESPKISCADVVRYLCLAHHAKMTELKTRCMDWLHDRWNKVKKLEEIQDLKKNDEGRQIIWELLDYVMNKKI